MIGSFPGLGNVLGARILGEIGDDRTRFAAATRGLKASAGTAPITRASGTKSLMTMRAVRNKRLGQAAYLWSLPFLAHSPGGRAHYDHHRGAGDSHSAASRHLANRGLGMLHHCLRTGQTYKTYASPRDEDDLWQSQGLSGLTGGGGAFRPHPRGRHLDAIATCDVP